VDKVNKFCQWSGTNYTGSFVFTSFANNNCIAPAAVPFRSGKNWLPGTGIEVWSGTNCTGSHYIFANNGTTINQTGDIGFTAHSFRRL